MIEMSGAWSWAQRHRKGLFSPLLKYETFVFLTRQFIINFHFGNNPKKCGFFFVFFFFDICLVITSPRHPFEAKMTYAPSDKAIRDKNLKLATYLFSPHVTWIYFLSSRFHSIRYRSRHLVDLFLRMLQSAFDSVNHMRFVA